MTEMTGVSNHRHRLGLSPIFYKTTHPSVDERISCISDESEHILIGAGIAIGAEFHAVR